MPEILIRQVPSLLEAYNLAERLLRAEDPGPVRDSQTSAIHAPDTSETSPMSTPIRVTLSTILLLAGAALVPAQGITIKRNGVVLFGSTANCTQPATVDWKKVRRATPEWKTIQSEGVRKGTGRYDLLISGLSTRVKRATAKAAETAGKDCVVPKSDLKSGNGLSLTDLTDAVIAGLDS